MASSTWERVLGIDPGTVRLGYAVIEVEASLRGMPRMRYVECGVIRAPQAHPLPNRLHTIAGELREVIVEFCPRSFAIEKAFHGKSAASALALGQARGALLLIAHEHGLPSFEYAPAQVKRVITGHGAASKADIGERVRLLFDLQTVPSADAADALAIACCHGLATAVGRDCAPARGRGNVWRR